VNKQKWILGIAVMILIGGTASLLAPIRAHQRLGSPGVKTHEIPGSICLQVDLPEKVLNYDSEPIPLDEITTNTLPKDTSFGQRLYAAPDRFMIQNRVVLMGTDRASMHKPQFCLEGQGWRIDTGVSAADTVRVERPFAYDLPVVKLITTKEEMVDGRLVSRRGVYVYWYVADDAMSASVYGFERMWMLATRMLRTGVLQRWSYVSCFSVCPPGQEDATYARMKQFIAEAVPEFQLYPRSPLATAPAQPGH
jgi:hypothetical protein